MYAREMVHLSMVDLRGKAAFAASPACGPQQRSEIITLLQTSLRERDNEPDTDTDSVQELLVLLAELRAVSTLVYLRCLKHSLHRVLQVPYAGPPWPPCPTCGGNCLDTSDVALPGDSYTGDVLGWKPDEKRWSAGILKTIIRT